MHGMGVSFVPNIGYENDCLWVWKAYNICPGKIVPWSKNDAVCLQSKKNFPRLLILEMKGACNCHL